MPPRKVFAFDHSLLHSLTDPDEFTGAARALGGTLPSLTQLLRTDPVHGRSKDSAQVRAERIRIFGVNTLPLASSPSFLELFREALFGDPIVRLLLIAAAASLIINLLHVQHVSTEENPLDTAAGWIEGAAIGISVLIVSLVTSINDWQKERQFKDLLVDAQETEAAVYSRQKSSGTGQHWSAVPRQSLLVGDVVELRDGMTIPADGLLVEGELKVDESALTGENETVTKEPVTDDLHFRAVMRSGTQILEGSGVYLVTAVGAQSLSGRIALAVRGAPEETPLQQQLGILADRIGKFGMIAAVSMVGALLLKEAWMVFFLGANASNLLTLETLVELATVAITLVVVAVPEGLPLSVTIALAYSMKSMMRENNLVRHLAACETMGNATTICTDKTGTLTQNQMFAARVHVAGLNVHVPLEARGSIDGLTRSVSVLCRRARGAVKLLAESIALNTSAKVARNSITGNKTEVALLALVQALEEDPVAIRMDAMGSSGRKSTSPTGERIRQFPFTSAKKTMTTWVREAHSVRAHLKGGAEIVLDLCTHETLQDGTSKPLTQRRRQELEELVQDFSSDSLRVMAVATARVSKQQQLPLEDTNDFPMGLTLLGMVGIEDPLRPEVPKAVAQCKRAGVAVRMVTGDHVDTAIAIAQQSGILPRHEDASKQRGNSGQLSFGGLLVLTGIKFRQLSQRQRQQILPKLAVVARASPLDKQLLVSSLMKRDDIVAVTGDGTNDAPALKHAHVGFAMHSGTDVAKHASDIVLLDDNFKSVVTALKWGRNVGEGIRKFLQFQITVNVAAVVIAFIGSLLSSNGESPLKPVQLLWLNLIMDTMAALALATEKPSDALLTKAPRSHAAPLISRRMWFNIAGQSLYQIALQLWFLSSHGAAAVAGLSPEDLLGPVHKTLIFNIFVLVQVANEFNARLLGREHNWWTGLLTRARMFCVIVLLTVIIQWLGVTYGGAFMDTVPLSWEQWKISIIYALVPLPLGFLLRLVPLPEHPGEQLRRTDLIHQQFD